MFLPDGRSFELSRRLLRGAIDIHVHAGPHIFSSPRRFDPFEAAIEARDAGMRAIEDVLWHALDRGVIDTVGSDHSAFAVEEKDGVANVFDAGFGVPGIATMYPLLFDRGVRRGRISLERLVATMSAAPTRALGLAGRKGSLNVGHDADSCCSIRSRGS